MLLGIGKFMKYTEYDSIYKQIKQVSESNQLVVFIGAGMSNNYEFPTWNGLVRYTHANWEYYLYI